MSKITSNIMERDKPVSVSVSIPQSMDTFESEESQKSEDDTFSSSEREYDLEEKYNKIEPPCTDERFYSSECNKFLLKKEIVESEHFSKHPDENSNLYPNLNDPNFNIKISTKKEFYDTKYDGKIHEDVKEYADRLANAEFELQPHQAFVKNFLSFQTPYNSLLLYHGLGTGKCMKKGTPIMMSDGRIKAIENVKEGDLLMGDDSNPRAVLSLARGVDLMYDIVQDNGDKYTVNQEHILCLRAKGFPKFNNIANKNKNTNTNTNTIKNYVVEWIQCNAFYKKKFGSSLKDLKEAETFYRNILNHSETNNNIVEIAVKDYLRLSKKKKSILKGFKTLVHFPEREITMDPYQVGYRLGLEDDSSKGIPYNYKCNSRENRLQLLAGLLDGNTDLHNPEKDRKDKKYRKYKYNYTFTQKGCLKDDFLFLARSLGLLCENNGDYNVIIRVSKVVEIPVKHQCRSYKMEDFSLDTNISVQYVNEDEYYGFTLDGNGRYLLGDFTVTHNTCSAIGVCEEMRDYMKQMGIKKRIIIVASENVQDNFRLQLFDERKLKLIDGVWNIRACTGNKLLQEINPMNMKGVTREKVVSQIKNLINNYYIFLGYVQFANYIIKTMNYAEELQRQQKETKERKGKIQKQQSKVELNKRIINRLRREFDSRLVVIDEVHNIRKTDDNENKKVAVNLELLVKSVQNMRFLLLSATPMYNSYKEIVWLLNLMNTNDRRGRIDVKDIFDKNGNFKEGGEELLMRKATGYISFVRGENPYTFPYRVYPSEFAKDNTFSAIKYPSHQMNLKKIKREDKNRILSLYLTQFNDCANCGRCQSCAYNYIIYSLRNKEFSVTTKTGTVKEMPNFENMESFGYTLLQTPLESLIISYPVAGLKEILDSIPVQEFSPSFSEESFTEELVKTTPIKEDEKEEEQWNTTISDEENSSGTTETLVDSDTFQEEEDVPTLDSSGTTETLVDSSETTETLVDSSGTTETLVDSSTEEQEGEGEGGQEEPQWSPSILSDDSSTERESSPVGGTKATIDPRILTGRQGLERMMNFVDSRVPPIKGDFEYKKQTVDNYGRIFSKEEIGAYSIKIKTILDNIVESDGIVLIYSQYIDSGLIPVALALEELGFTRYGEPGTKPLFKETPVPVVDVRTMKPPDNKKDFVPARYSLITGEPRLSPNNDFEVKGLTGEDNRDGKKVKVVLISKAGSEGIDLKFIRQVHILEPWYNMNRSEQIIGRAVRNFSHKDLPFEKRNVQIFMYGTILPGNIEETADLYVYRVAEYKAKQIGKVSRVLKETAVDCIIHHDQTNFTQDNMTMALNEPIRQLLSNGQVLDNFKIGDAPFSPACDYMATCEYQCRPNAEVDETQLNEDTYDEKFILVNSEKILQRIRMLMKESFFYKKEDLLKKIRIQKEYPYVQIYAALTQLIEDQSEFISDRYGRDGRLVNIGEYYLFQPVELQDTHSSLFDRNVPIDYKHDMAKFIVKQQEKKEPKQTLHSLKTSSPSDIKDVSLFSEGRQIMDEMKQNFEVSAEFAKKTGVPRGHDNWYEYYGIAAKKMTKDYPDIKPYLIPFLMAHMIEVLLFDEKLALMNYLYSLDNIKNTKSQLLEWNAKEYFETNILTTKHFKAIVLFKLGKSVIMILDENNQWIEADPEDQKEIAQSSAAKDIRTFNVSEYNRYVGFIGYEKSKRYLVFKSKDMTSKRDTGARCDESGKPKIMKKLNEILGEEIYTSENTKAQTVDGKKIEAVSQNELCVVYEFLLRYYNNIKKDGKRWFLTPEMAIMHNLYSL